ncbi:MAG: S9 family peptidase [Candidatus Bathyarchaeota archaeon]|nr:S9 family peptidase [Candidatus Bathyarchaeota archaeon]MDH5788112.1 S9 family peptidase [Candidatus Bathyarchaeota archaeon]
MGEKEYTIDTLSKIPQIWLPVVSHSRDKVAFYFDKTGIIEMYVCDLRTNGINQVSHGECPRALRAGFVWTIDDRDIIFAKDKYGNENHDLIKINVASGKTDSLTNTPEYQEYAADTSSDSRFLAMISTRKGQLNLFRLDLQSKEVIELTDHANPTWGGCSWNPKHDWIAYDVNETKDMRNMDIWLVRTDGSEKKRIVSVKEGSQDTVARWNKDGKLLAFTTDANGVKQAGIYNLETGETKLLGKLEYEETAADFSDDGKKLVCLRNCEATVFPVIYDVETGNCEETQYPKGIAMSVQFALDDRFLVSAINTPTIPSAFVAYDIGNRKIKYLIEPQYGEVDSKFFVMPEYVKYESFDGVQIPAIVYKPKDIFEGKKLPALIMPHGGPTAQYFYDFHIMGQILANEGYVLLLPNVRGSTGYGRKFQDMNLMDWGGADLEDVVAGAKYLKALPYVDKAKLGVFGGSYGGFMTFLAVTKKPDLWAAAVAWIGISHLKTFYERSQPHFRYFVRMHLGDPEKNSKLWEDRSALNYAQNLRCPLLMVHGKNDPRCPVEESRQFRDKLIELGKKEGADFEYVEFGDEGHGAYTDMTMRTRTFKILIDFFNRKLKN